MHYRIKKIGEKHCNNAVQKKYHVSHIILSFLLAIWKSKKKQMKFILTVYLTSPNISKILSFTTYNQSIYKISNGIFSNLFCILNLQNLVILYTNSTSKFGHASSGCWIEYIAWAAWVAALTNPTFFKKSAFKENNMHMSTEDIEKQTIFLY